MLVQWVAINRYEDRVVCDPAADTVAYVRPEFEIEDLTLHLRDILRDPAKFRGMGSEGAGFCRTHIRLSSTRAPLLNYANVHLRSGFKRLPQSGQNAQANGLRNLVPSRHAVRPRVTLLRRYLSAEVRG